MRRGAKLSAAQLCCLSPVWNTGWLCDNEYCRLCRSKTIRSAQRYQHAVMTEPMIQYWIFSNSNRFAAIHYGCLIKIGSRLSIFPRKKSIVLEKAVSVDIYRQSSECLTIQEFYEGNVQNFSHIEWLNRFDASLSRVHQKFSC